LSSSLGMQLSPHDDGFMPSPQHNSNLTFGLYQNIGINTTIIIIITFCLPRL
jgi:hypothetical protein